MVSRQNGSFWKWFGIIALLHVVALVLVMLFYHPTDSTPATPPFFSLMPQGDVVKGTPGAPTAPKVGAGTPAPAHHHHHPQPKPVTPPVAATPPPATPMPAKVPPPPKPVELKPPIDDETAPAIVEAKPKPAPPKPKIKVDLHLADGPVSDQPPVRPKHVKKTPPPVLGDDSPDEPGQDSTTRQMMGLSKEEVASRLGKKLADEGVANATQVGKSGDVDGHENKFSDFYGSIYNQLMDKWQVPNQDDTQAVDPIVQIHVDHDGRVPPERVVLLHSSGNQAIDDSALGAARSMGYTLEPLPDGCPPDISINFKLSH